MNPQTAETAWNSNGCWYLALNPAFGNQMRGNIFHAKAVVHTYHHQGSLNHQGPFQGTQPSALKRSSGLKRALYSILGLSAIQ